MTRIRTLFAEALRSIGANVSTTVASALSVLIGMFLIGIFIGLGTWLVSWSDDKKRELAVHVFIKDGATTKQIDALRVLLESDERVKAGGIDFVTKAEALAFAWTALILIAGGLAIGALGSGLTVRRFLRV